jgi:hypothetical protein
MRGVVLVGVLISAVTGCGSAADVQPAASPTATISSLPGPRVGELAEKQLEAEHLEMALGSVTCPDLEWRVNASVRCLKISQLSNGRRVTVPGTVTVTSTRGWGKLHVELDDQVSEFGVDDGHLSRDVGSWVADKAGEKPASVHCPYLRGVRGAVVTCSVSVAGKRSRVLVRVTDVDPGQYLTRYTMRWQKVP